MVSAMTPYLHLQASPPPKVQIHTSGCLLHHRTFHIQPESSPSSRVAHPKPRSTSPLEHLLSPVQHTRLNLSPLNFPQSISLPPCWFLRPQTSGSSLKKNLLSHPTYDLSDSPFKIRLQAPQLTRKLVLDGLCKAQFLYKEFRIENSGEKCLSMKRAFEGI